MCNISGEGACMVVQCYCNDCRVPRPLSLIILPVALRVCLKISTRMVPTFRSCCINDVIIMQIDNQLFG